MLSPKTFRISLLIIAIIVVFSLLLVKYKRENDINEKLQEKEKVWIEKQQKFFDWKHDIDSELSDLRELAFDPYKGRTLLTENKLVLQNYTVNEKHAIVTMIGSASYVHPYWMGAIAMIQSLREVQTRIPNIVVMVRLRQLIPQFAYEAFERLGVKIVYIDALEIEKLNVKIPGTWEGAFDKLNVWSLIEYEKILFLDADTLIVQNIDHLMNYDQLTAPYTPTNCQCNAEFVKNPEFFTISSGFFVCKPSAEVFSQMVTLASGQSPDPDDLAQFNGTWHWGDQEMLRVVFTQLSDNWNPLNWEYDLPVGMCSCPQRRTKPIYSYHFVCTYPVPKPWADAAIPLYAANVKECQLEIYHLWYRLLAKGLNSNEITDTVKRNEENIITIPKADPNNRVNWN